jgi:hypothetical protein
MSNETIFHTGTKTNKLSSFELKQNAGLPVWIRAPKQGGVDLFCGLTRSKLYELASKGRIKSVSLRESHQIRGTRLFNLPSILSYIESKKSPMER